MQIIERRRLARFQIPEAEVHYKQEEGFFQSQAVEGVGKLVDLTVKGIRFESNEKLCLGARIELDIVIPGKEKISLMGHILWTTNFENHDQIYTVVEFVDFDDKPGYNSLEQLQALEKLKDEYSESQ